MLATQCSNGKLTSPIPSDQALNEVPVAKDAISNVENLSPIRCQQILGASPAGIVPPQYSQFRLQSALHQIHETRRRRSDPSEEKRFHQREISFLWIFQEAPGHRRGRSQPAAARQRENGIPGDESLLADSGKRLIYLFQCPVVNGLLSSSSGGQAQLCSSHSQDVSPARGHDVQSAVASGTALNVRC